jgi:sporulation protein YlmC with PRC-barrel domain
MNSKHLRGLAVISIADGEKVGTIDRVYIDMNAKRVAGFSVAHGAGLLHLQSTEESELIDADDVHALGPDALTLNDRSAVRGDRAEARFDSLIELEDLLRHKVVTDGGTSLGQVTSVEIDPASFAVLTLEVSPGFFQSNADIPADKVLNTGSELVVVDESVLGPAEDQSTVAETTPITLADEAPTTPATDR